eukprot:764527-Hanusia_phi.AAC.6
MAELEVDAQDVVRLMLQFCKENGLKVREMRTCWQTPMRLQPPLPPRDLLFSRLSNPYDRTAGLLRLGCAD